MLLVVAWFERHGNLIKLWTQKQSNERPLFINFNSKANVESYNKENLGLVVIHGRDNKLDPHPDKHGTKRCE